MNGETQLTHRLRGTFKPIAALSGLEAQWRALEEQSACSFFQSWSWIGAWLQLIGVREGLRIYQCYKDDNLIALGIVSQDMIRRRHLFRSQVVSINEVNNPDLNMFIEYNGLLTLNGCEAEALQQLIGDLDECDPSWDELNITNIPQQTYLGLRLERLNLQPIHDSQSTPWIASLENAAELDAIINRLSRNRRWQIRRSIKEYEKEGPLRIEAATTVEEALNYFRLLGILHTERWNRVGLKGSFAKPNWVLFHQSLIASAFNRGEIQLLRIRCGSRDIGYIYNFLWRDSVLMVQSGFVSEQRNVFRPGYISHIMAMQLNAQRGAALYDFMIGDAEYKQVLATAHPPLISLRLQRRRISFIVENSAVHVFRQLRQNSAIRTIKNFLPHHRDIDTLFSWGIGLNLCLKLQDALDSPFMSV